MHKRAYALGNPIAADRLAWLHGTILVDDEPTPIPDEVRMMTYLEEGARRPNAACMELLAAIRQYRMVARASDDESMQELLRYYQTSGSVVDIQR